MSGRRTGVWFEDKEGPSSAAVAIASSATIVSTTAVQVCSSLLQRSLELLHDFAKTCAHMHRIGSNVPKSAQP